MHPVRLSCAAGIIAAGTALAADPAIDLRGKVVAADGGKGVAGARATLLAAGASDTTDTSGVFRILANGMSILPPGGIGGHGRLAVGSLEIFDVSGRLIADGAKDGDPRADLRRRSPAMDRPPLKAVRIGPLDGTPLYAGLPSGSAGRNADAASGAEPLAKTLAVADTLLVTHAGFRAAKVPVADYRMTLDTIRLQAEAGGFEIRKPAGHSIPCGSSTLQVLDADLLCESGNDSLQASVYVQSKPVACVGLSGAGYEVENAWIRTGEEVRPVEAVYDGGGNHHNDRLTVSWNGKFYSFYHSSIGFGFRSCAPPDCMQICQDKECRAVLYDGCTRAACSAPPALKVSCAVVQSDGTVPGPIDPWTAIRPGTSNPMLPCAGDPVCK